MVVIDFEAPLLLLLAAFLCAIAAWLLGGFSTLLHGRRYRISMGILGFALSGFMGFVCALRLAAVLAPDWLATQPLAVSIGIAGYLLFGFLGCWTATRIAGGLDRKDTLSTLYSLVEKKKKTE